MSVVAAEVVAAVVEVNHRRQSEGVTGVKEEVGLVNHRHQSEVVVEVEEQQLWLVEIDPSEELEEQL